MIPDLGKYQAEVLAAYAVAILLLAAIVAITLSGSIRAARKLKELKHNPDDEAN